MSYLNLYVSGLWPSPDRNGLPALASMIDLPGDKSLQQLHTDDLVSIVQLYLKNWPDLLIRGFGYSFGGDACVKACIQLNALGIQVDQLILLDPVRPGWWFAGGDFEIPPNVTRSVCIKKSWWFPPSVAIKGQTPIVISTWSHANFPKNVDVVDAVKKAVMGG